MKSKRKSLLFNLLGDYTLHICNDFVWGLYSCSTREWKRGLSECVLWCHTTRLRPNLCKIWGNFDKSPNSWLKYLAKITWLTLIGNILCYRLYLFYLKLIHWPNLDTNHHVCGKHCERWKCSMDTIPHQSHIIQHMHTFTHSHFHRGNSPWRSLTAC